jgi:cytochrome P450 family 4
MLLLLITLCVIPLAALSFFFKGIKQFVLNYLELKKIPGPPISNIIFGSIPTLHTSRENIFQKLRQWARIYYPIYNISFLHKIITFLHTPEDCELIMSNPKHNTKSRIYNVLHPWLGTGLLTSTGSKWSTRRRILTPSFHFSILQQFVTVFNEETEQLVETFKKLCDQPFIDVTQHVTQFTLKTITETAMGTKLKFEDSREIEYKKAIFDMGEIVVYRLTYTWLVDKVVNMFRLGYLKERRVVNTLHRFTSRMIAEREKTFEEVQLPKETDEVYTTKRRLAMLDLLLSAKKKDNAIDDTGIREEVDTFTFEGHDTTSAALSFALMLIACNRSVQDQIVEEIEAVLGDVHKRPTYNDLQEMKYLERTVKEVLRLYPSVHMVSRKTGEEVVTGSGYVIPKNSIVLLQIYDIHHDPKIYPDPEKFDPDRFLPENSQNRHPFAYLPFSAGSRNCIGQRFAMLELKAAICGILANFVLHPVDTPETIVFVIDLILRTKEGIKVKFVPRNF